MGCVVSSQKRVKMDFIPVSSPSLREEDAAAVASAIRQGWISSEGPQVQEFEREFADLIGVEHAVAVANGTAALDIAVESLGIAAGDEVILPSFTIISCLGQILRAGATPIFVDSLRDTWNLDPQQVRNAITPRTKAIIGVHIYGLPADIDEIVAIGNEHGIPVIEDAAEGHGQHLNAKPLGSWGKISTFSFYSNKLITTGEGGMLLTDDVELANKARQLRNLSFNSEQRFVHHSIGWNYRITSMQAALGLSQLKRLDTLLEQKKEIGRHYQDLLGSLEDISLPMNSYRGSENVYWVFGIVLPEDSPLTAKAVMEKLSQKGIGTRPFFYPLHRQPVLSAFKLENQEALPVSEWLGNKGFYLPSGSDSTTEKREYVARELKRALSS
ncbi:DegT/DnrJ/EryC1/StrS family aminotransferase [Pontimonas sp.]|nr:DegT/DnrJ/EryC1/StrS family aminotransferase [Pontimonas sp.]